MNKTQVQFRTRRESLAATIPPKPVFILRTVADVHALLEKSRNFLGTRKMGEVRVRAPELLAHEAAMLEVRLNAWAQECGCGAGAIFASIALVVSVVSLFMTEGSLRHWRLGPVLWAGLACFLCALVGKVVGLARARVRFTSELQRLRTRLSCVAQ
jgi:hypothetical protein